MKDYIEEYVLINGIRQYFLHYPAQTDTVLLFLHGGPGQSEAHLAYRTRPASPVCSFVYYDQRGTGKTQLKNKSKPQEINIGVLLEDLKATICYLKDKYKTEKLILLGHSWGSLLGTEYVKRYPETVSAYIGTGQVVNIEAGELAGYDKMKSLIEGSGNAGDLARLKRMDGYPQSFAGKNFTKALMRFRRLQMKYNICPRFKDILRIVWKSPVFSLGDIPPFISCMKVNKNLYDLLLGYNTGDFIEYGLPVFYVLGRNDWQVPSTVAEEYFNRIMAPKKKLYWIENAGHLTDVDNPGEFNKTIGSICAEI